MLTNLLEYCQKREEYHPTIVELRLRDIHMILSQLLRTVLTEPRVSSVSYTHLDVYKRQVETHPL